MFGTLAIALSLWTGLNADRSLAGVAEPVPVSGAHAASRAFRAGAVGRTLSSSDTVWVGYSAAYAGSNYWSIGRGAALPGVDNNGLWNWDSPVHGDSLLGWWPIRRSYSITGGIVLADRDRPWWALDYGNQANYVINQAPPIKRTFGVVGVWHRDHGSPSGGGVAWTPIAGAYSAWCGLRRHDDNAFVDPVTGNSFNQKTLDYNGENSALPGATSKGFPGYASQWDQMLYRDVDITSANAAANVSVSFRYRSRMSTGRVDSAEVRTGWFDKDPLAVVPGNFISSSDAGASAPIDSFMVYVGVPVGDSPGALWTGSDGNTHQVFDPTRRWFAEVIRANDVGGYYELFSTYGNRPTISAPNGFVIQTATRAVTYGALRAAWGNKIRCVFRVKTNRGFDDQDTGGAGYSSNGLGAVQLDNITIDLGAGPVLLGDFESASSIDNRTSVAPLNAWKSTGKPPGVFFHRHDFYDLPFMAQDPSVCNLSGFVISAGEHDLGEAAGGYFGTAEQERMDGIISPTINLAVNSADSSAKNNMGIDVHVMSRMDQICVRHETYTGMLDLPTFGNAWTIGVQSYPASQSGSGTSCWGDIYTAASQFSDPIKECRTDVVGLRDLGLVHTSNASGVPDSIRIFIGKQQQCFRFNLTTECGSTLGAYFDNVSVGFPASFAGQCHLTSDWHAGPAINLSPIQYWPSGSKLRQMRPADAIAIRADATDSDLLEVTCTACDGQSWNSMPFGPYLDEIEYVWHLGSIGGRGRLVEPDAEEKNVVIYQLPTCGWQVDGLWATLRDTLELTVQNSFLSNKAKDPSHTGTRIIFTMEPCEGDNERFIAVTVDVQPGSAPPGEIVLPSGNGDCVPQEPQWAAGDPIRAPHGIVEADPTNLCPNYLTLLSIDPTVGPFDPDDCSMTCKPPPGQQCTPGGGSRVGLDKLLYTWTLLDPPDPILANRYFPLGNAGSVLAVQRSRTKTLTVKCTISNPPGRAVDPPIEWTFTVAPATRPKAFVGLGDNDMFRLDAFRLRAKLPSTFAAATEAKKAYEKAGYVVTFRDGVTEPQVMSAMGDPCYQAMWIGGHGNTGYVTLADGHPFNDYDPALVSEDVFHCRVDQPDGGFLFEAHPFIREVVAMGCSTYSMDWVKWVLCGKVISFTYDLRPFAFGTDWNPEHYEYAHHDPLEPHDFAAEP